MPRPTTPFIIKLEAAILREGEFPDIKSFVYNYIYKGFTFKSLNKIIEERYGIKTTFNTTHENLRKFAPPAYNVHTRHHFKRRAVAGRKGGEKVASVTYFVNEMIRKGKTTKEIGEKLKINPRNALRDLQKSYPIDFKGKTIFPDMARFGMKRTSHYYKWLKQAEKFGFDSVVDAIEYFLLEKKIPLREVAFIFNTSSGMVQRRIKKCEYLNKKIKFNSKRRKNVNSSNCGTDV